MKAWTVTEHGGPDRLAFGEVPQPEPAAGELLVRVQAAGLNFLDTLMIEGRYQVKPPLPFTPGVELAGTVLTAAKDDSPFQPGDRVAAMVRWGAFAEVAAVPAVNALAIPPNTDAAAALPLITVYPTALHGLVGRAGLKAGETLLVLAGAGGVGLAAIQIGRALGARVLATAGSEDKRAVCRDHGAEAAFDYRSPDWIDAVKAATGGRGVDVIFDPVGGDITAGALRCMGWGCRLLVVGFAGGDIPAVPANRLLLREASAMGVYWGGLRASDPATAAATLQEVMAMAASKRIAPVISRVYEAAALPQALSDLAERRTVGKVAIRMGPE